MRIIVLPANTFMEVDDILTNIRQGTQQPNIMIADKAIEPIGESKSDAEIVLEVSKKVRGSGRGPHRRHDHPRPAEKDLGIHGRGETGQLGAALGEEILVLQHGRRLGRRFTRLPQFLQRSGNVYKLATPTGKLEFYSEALAKAYPDDKERPPIPKWIEKSHNHDERLSSHRAQMFSMLMMSNHGRWRVHAQCDDITWTREAPTGKIHGTGWIQLRALLAPYLRSGETGNQKWAISSKIYNERGIVLGGAYVTERLRPGVVYMDHGARHDPIKTGEIERGGAINTITPEAITSENCVGQIGGGYLVEVAKVTAEMDQWRRDYPEAFEREYDPAAGLRFDAWVVGGDQQ
jgi:anaerobic selenocysteine-containing dehydrogenase